VSQPRLNKVMLLEESKHSTYKKKRNNYKWYWVLESKHFIACYDMYCQYK